MTLPKRVLAAMSGGVDSAVAAARAVEAGYDVTGVHLALSSTPQLGDGKGKGCCTISDARDARRSADILGIPFYVWDMAEEFKAGVMDDFLAEYSAGRTPNPCMRCNEQIKFAAVLDRAIDLGFDAVCTGHYAQIVESDSGELELHRSVDLAKDQSYVLAVIGPEQLARSMFPLGDSVKGDVRDEAASRGLLVARKPDSHDICFIPDGDTAGFLRRKLGEAPGEIVDAQTGEVLGEHAGAYAYTVGQRKGLGLTVPGADGAPRYVVGVDPVSRVVSVGPPTLLDVDVIVAVNPRWAGPPAALGQDCLVQIRAHAEPVAATVEAIDESHGFTVGLGEKLRGVAAGQTAVLYDGTRVIGSATIDKTRRRAVAIA